MAALMISTAFTEFFHMTLWFGIPFTLLLVVAYHVQSRRAACRRRSKRRKWSNR